jgi:hypothetical protein
MTIGPGYEAAAAGRAQLRTSAEDRDHAVDLLNAAFAEGRLGKPEYETRVERALSARTFAELDALVTDLPGVRPPSMPPLRPRTNPLAITSLICGVAQFFFFGLTTIPAIVTGHLARRQIRRTGEEGAGMALAGLLLGWAVVAMVVLLAAVGVIFLVAAGSGH